MNKAKLPTHIELDEKYGLSKESVILLEQVRTIDKIRLKEKMGHIDNETMSMVNKAISVSFGL
jgi:mRNA interferase MazF